MRLVRGEGTIYSPWEAMRRKLGPSGGASDRQERFRPETQTKVLLQKRLLTDRSWAGTTQVVLAPCQGHAQWVLRHNRR